MKLRASLVWAGLAVLCLWPQAAVACIPVVDGRGRQHTPVVEPEQVFVGKLTSVRAPDRREIAQLRARWDHSPARRAEPDADLIQRFNRFTRVAEFEIQTGDTRSPTRVSVWFESNGVCSGPFNEGLPLEVGQTAVVFSEVIDGWMTGWIPNSVSVEKLRQPQLVETMEHLFRQLDHCPQGAQEERYSLPVTFLRAPKSGFGRGCMVEAH